jgi:hypothetical protein
MGIDIGYLMKTCPHLAVRVVDFLSSEGLYESPVKTLSSISTTTTAV